MSDAGIGMRTRRRSRVSSARDNVAASAAHEQHANENPADHQRRDRPEPRAPAPPTTTTNVMASVLRQITDDIVKPVAELGRNAEYWGLIFLGLCSSMALMYGSTQLLKAFGLLAPSHSLLDFFVGHLPDAILTLMAAIPAYLFKIHADRKRRLAFSNLEFYKCINFSLNWFENIKDRRTLFFSSLMEENLDDVVYHNPLVTDYVLAAAEATTPSRCIMFCDENMSEAETGQLYMPLMKATVNTISCELGSGSLDHVAGLPTRCVTLRFVYTCEKGPLVPQTKIRVMLIEPHVLEAIESHVRDNAEAEPPAFLASTHAPRWETLKEMAELNRRAPQLIGKVRIYRPLGAATATKMHF